MKKIIKNLLKVRRLCAAGGDIKLIEIKDLLFIDDLIFNILNNIVRYKIKIHDIKDIFEFSEKYEAEKILNQKSRYQFGKFELMRKHYSENNYKEI